nr:hypothetical protein [Pseudomonas fluorescens]
MLSTGHKDGYSQGLTHRNTFTGVNIAHEKVVSLDVIFRLGIECSETSRTGRHEWPAWYQRKSYLPMQKLEKIRPSKSSELNAPVISPNSCCA